MVVQGMIEDAHTLKLIVVHMLPNPSIQLGVELTHRPVRLASVRGDVTASIVADFPTPAWLFQDAELRVQPLNSA